MDYQQGDLVRYDDARGVVLERIATGRAASDDYMIEWEDGSVGLVWGSDLVPAEGDGE